MFEAFRKKRKKNREISFNNANIRYNERQRLIWQTFDYLKENQVYGDYHEYGCHKAMTFRMALADADRKDIEWMKFYAFDSFEGLPEPSGIDRFHLNWKRGALTTSESQFMKLVKKQGKLVDRVETVKGFYNQSLTSVLQKSFLEKNQKVAFAFIDCDLYESTVDVLKFIDPLLQPGSVIYFDDFYHFQGDPARGEQKAMREWLEKSKWLLNPHLQAGWFGKSFIVYPA